MKIKRVTQKRKREISNQRAIWNKGLERGKQEGKQEIIERAKAYNGQIKTEDDLFNHIDRLEKCSECDKVFWDKRCPTCRKKEIDFYVKEMQEKFNDLGYSIFDGEICINEKRMIEQTKMIDKFIESGKQEMREECIKEIKKIQGSYYVKIGTYNILDELIQKLSEGKE